MGTVMSWILVVVMVFHQMYSFLITSLDTATFSLSEIVRSRSGSDEEVILGGCVPGDENCEEEVTGNEEDNDEEEEES
jgi:hypothetical protein